MRSTAMRLAHRDNAKLAPPTEGATPVETRGRLLAAAETLVRTRGYAGFSYADLAEAVGIRKASVHHHFPSKEDLGTALVVTYRERYEGALKAICEESESGIERIEAYAKLYLEGLTQDQGCLCGVMACERDILPQRIREGIEEFFEAHLMWLERVLEAGTKNATIRRDVDPAATSKLVLSSLEGMLMLGRLTGQAREIGATVSALLRSLR
ncbi:MAG: TetR/AcrR family transcriptional regulator [Beijerinckiaceae bacterium]|nr:TetR/AcrR family transcriptional regulator [Beijerinckiaceae bacterium]